MSPFCGTDQSKIKHFRVCLPACLRFVSRLRDPTASHSSKKAKDTDAAMRNAQCRNSAHSRLSICIPFALCRLCAKRSAGNQPGLVRTMTNQRRDTHNAIGTCMPAVAALILLAASANQHVASAFSTIGGSNMLLFAGSNRLVGGGTGPLVHGSSASFPLSMAADGDKNNNGSTNVKSLDRQPPVTPLTTASEPPGLGGKSGIRPDVNSLKRNLVQEAVKAYKSELLELLGTPHGGKEYFPPTAAAVATKNASGSSTSSTSNTSSDPASATSSPLYGSGGSAAGAETQLYDEARDGGRPVSYYKYGPGAAAYGRTYAGEWATRDELIEEKLAALVQANPVSTTTDSNLLEGSWEYVFSSHKASDIVDPSRFVLIRTEQAIKQAKGATGANGTAKASAATANKEAVGPVESRPWAIRSGRSENPLRSLTRKIYLEELKDDEDPYVIDTTAYMGGLWSVQRRYDVTGLTRTAMDLGLKEKDMKAFGMRIPLKKQRKKAGSSEGASGGKTGDEYLGKAKVQVIYLDGDLCITTTEQGMEGPLLVYTKREFWTAMRKSRFLLATASWVWSKQSPLRIRQRLQSVLPFGRKSNQDASMLPNSLIPGDQQLYTDEENRMMLQRTYADPSGSSRLMVLKMGEPLINADGTLREDLADAWDGESDPFVHLNPIERQKMIKGMTIEAIEAAGKAQRDANKRSGGRYRQNTPIDRSFRKKVTKERSFKKPQ